MTYFLTFQGTLLGCVANAGVLVLTQCPLDTTTDDAEPVSVNLPVEHLRCPFDHFLANTRPALDQVIGFNRIGAVGIGAAKDQRCVTLSVQGRFLAAEADGRIAARDETDDWTGFLPISDTELAMLRRILANDWVIRSTQVLVRAGAVSMQHWYGLWVGELKIDLRYQLPFDPADWPFRVTLLRDGWRIEQLCLYRPLIYSAAYMTPAVIRQLHVCIRSLIEIGQYNGHVLALTDQAPEAMAAALPSMAPGHFQSCPVAAVDFVGFVASKYKILEFPWATSFQPVLFVDPDIVFDVAVEPMLCAVACSDQISAPQEAFSPLRTTPSVGSGLLRLDGCTTAFAVGFNAGTLGIPNIPGHAATLRLIRRIIETHAAVHGRSVFPWVDQEVANYVSFRLANFSPALNGFVRYGGWPNTEPSTDGRVGLVHFWAAGNAEDKLAAMLNYRLRVDAAIAASRSR